MRTSKPRVRALALIGLLPLLLIAVGGLAPVERADAASIDALTMWPTLASTNSCRWVRVTISWNPQSETITNLSVSGSGTPVSWPDPQWSPYRIMQSSNEINPYNVFNNYASIGSTSATRTFTIGPYCGSWNAFNQRPADYPYISGYVGSPGGDKTQPANANTYLMYAYLNYVDSNGGHQVQTNVGYQTVHDNDDYLVWGLPGSNLDPLTVSPVEPVKDSGSSSNTFRFKVRYFTGLYSNLNYPPRWRTSETFPHGGSMSSWGFHDRSAGYAQNRYYPNDVAQFNWLYGRTTDPWLDQTGFTQSEYDSRGATEPELLVVIDGQHWAPHYMLRENPADGNFVDGVDYVYEIRPTDYLNFIDNIFLNPFDLPGRDSWDDWAVRLAGRPASNNYAAFTAGKHTYEFWATDDFAPPNNRAWVQVGWPGNDLHSEYIRRIAPEPRRVDGLRSAVQRTRLSVFNQYSSAGTGQPYDPSAIINAGDSAAQQDRMRRFGDQSVDQPDTYGYAFKSHEASTDADYLNLDNLASADPVLSLRKFPDVNPVLSAHPFFGLPGREGGITTPLPVALGGPAPQDPEAWAGGYMDNDIPNNVFFAPTVIGAVDGAAAAPHYRLPFTPEIGAGPDPTSSPAGPWKFTNDDTILPNFVNIWNELAPTPFRGGKWTATTNFTLRINYWHSQNFPPRFIRVHIRRNDPDAAPGSWFTYTMENVDLDGDYRNGAVYQYQATPDQLPRASAAQGGGPGEYNYYFEANDGTRTAIFPDRPDRYTFQDERNATRNIDDPGDLGIATGAAGRDHYWFRVNQAPLLASASVTPSVGRTGAPFTFQVTYTDPDGQASVPNALGDRPFVAYLYVDLYGDSYGALKVGALAGNQWQFTVNAGGHTFTNNELAGLFVVMADGTARRNIYRIVSNAGNVVSLVSNPNDPDNPGKLLTDGVSVGDTLYFAQRTAMSKQDTSDNNYTDGVTYVFNTGTNMILGPGQHKYFFIFGDDWGGWVDPTETNVKVEGEYVRFPNAGAFSGPEVLQNTAPQLVDFRFLPQDVGTAPDGSTSTPFTFYVTYTDQENDPPAFIRLQIDGNTTLSLVPDDPQDQVYTDGVVYKSQPISLTEGQHFMSGQCSDGKLRFPPANAYPPSTPLPFLGPIASVTGGVTTSAVNYSVGGRTFPTGRYDGGNIQITMLSGAAAGTSFTVASNAMSTLNLTGGSPSGLGVAANDTFIFGAAPGPNVARNTPPQLVFPDNDNVYAWDPLNPVLPGLEPDNGVPNDPVSGTTATTFTYSVIYIDNDQFAGVRGNPPAYVQLYIDNIAYSMQKVDPTDNDYTDDGTSSRGALYQITAPGAGVPALTEGTPHTYFFVASDGLDTARLPQIGTLPGDRYNGPAVDGRPDPAQQLFVTDVPNDNGEALQFRFNASLDDGGGADDVTEYHLYRNQSGAPFASPPILVIPATGAPSYQGQDTAQLTGLMKATDYFYVVRAYDGSTIDPDGDRVPNLSDDNDGDGQPDIILDPLDQSQNSNIQGPVRAEDNNPPGAPSNVTAVDPGLGGTIDLNWSLSPDDGAGNGDVSAYRVYRNTTGAPYQGAPLVTLPAQTNTYRDESVTDGTNYYYAVSAWDGANESARIQAIPAPISPSDNAPPEIVNLVPADGVVDVPRATNIAFDVRDTGAGVDIQSLDMTVTVNNQPVTGTITTTGTPAQYHVVFNPDVDFGYLVSVYVDVEVSDLAVPTPITAQKSYHFTIVGPPIYEIRGTVVDQLDPQIRVQNVIVRAFPVGGGQALSATTDATGNYTIQGLASGQYIVIPSKLDTSFMPEQSIPLTVPPSPQRADFTAGPGFDITGTVTSGQGAPLIGVRVTDGVHEDITDGAGHYDILDVAAGDYTVVPQLAGFAFTPPSQDVTVSTQTGNVTADFVGEAETFSIAGSIRTANGERLGNVKVDARDGTSAVVNSDDTLPSGSYFIDGLPAQFYTVKPSKQGWVFEPAIRDVDLAGDRTNIDFIAIPLYDYLLPPGLHMVSFPVLPQNLNPAVNLPAGVNIARWDPTAGAGQYIMGNPGSPLPAQYEMVPGRSFWVRNTIGSSLGLQVAGQPVATDIPFSLGVERGWNQAGNMFNGPLPWANLQIGAGQAVRDYGFLYTGNEMEPYELVTDLVGIGTTNIVPRNAGFWIKSDAKRTVMVSSVGTAEATAETPAVGLAAGDYLIPVVAKTADRADSISVAGVVSGSDGKYLIDNPPAVSPYLDVYFTNEAGAQLACDVRSAQAGAQKWDFVVATDIAGATVALSLPDLSGVPADKSVTLVDTATGKRLYARTMGAYTFTAGENGARRFSLEVGPKAAGGLVVGSAMAAQTAAGAQITYTLSANAEVTATVMNIAGRPVSTVSTAGVAQKGANTMAWNLKSQAGTPVPAGRYIVRITATAENGQVASTVTSLQVNK